MTSPSSESVALTTSTSRISRFPTIGVAQSRRYRVHLSPPYLPQVQSSLAQYSNDVWLRRWCRPEHPGGSASASKDGHAHAFLRGRHVAQFNCHARCAAEARSERSGAATSERRQASATTVQFFPSSSIIIKLLFSSPPPLHHFITHPSPQPLAQDKCEGIKYFPALTAAQPLVPCPSR
jgi:hypothetical protein